MFDGSRRKTPRHRAHFAIRIGSRRRRVQATRRRSGESACHDDDPRRPLATNVSASAFVATLSIPTPRTLAHSPRDTHRESACAQSAFKWLVAIQNLNVQEWPKACNRNARLYGECVARKGSPIASRADALSPSARMATDIETRLRAHGFSYKVENVQYENASHLLMGFGPGQTEFRVNDRFTIHFGGTTEGTERARNSGWARAKEFLARL